METFLSSDLICVIYNASICRLEGIPIMDGALGVRGLNVKSPGTDAFCSLTFAGAKPFKSKIKTVKGNTRLSMNPVFNCDLWYPISIPTMTQVNMYVYLSSTSCEKYVISFMVP